MKRRLNSPLSRLLALLLTGVVLASPLLPAAYAVGTDVSIRSVEDLTALAQNCTLDTWSQGKTVRLEADLDLTGVDFSPISTFGGIFEGGGHTISGFTLDGESTLGLFRCIQSGAVVRELSVEGTLSATGSQSVAGGIVGLNYGTVDHCTFSGTVSGKHRVGGIAGLNEAGGALSNCTTTGSITGEQATGGIVGENAGSVTGCTNQSAVNTAAYTPDRSLEESLGIPEPNELSGLAADTAELLDTTSDTGGIAGYSTGVLRACQNKGEVGYPHIGYNVGGVAGRSSGYIDGCSNAGLIQGRKDVGGIAGQLAPNILLIFSRSTAQDLESALNELDTLLNRTLDRAQANNSTLSSRLSSLSDYASAAADSAGDLADSTVDWAADSLEEVNDIGSALADTLDQLEGVTAQGQGILDQTADGLEEMRGGLDEFRDALDLGSEGMDGLAQALDQLESAAREGQDALTLLQKATQALARTVVVEDPAAAAQAAAQVQQSLNQLAASLSSMQTALADLRQLLQQLPSAENPSLQPFLDALERLRLGFHTAAGAIRDLAVGSKTWLDSWRLDLSQARTGLDGLSDASGVLSQAAAILADGLNQLESAAGSFSGLSAGLADGSSGFAQGMKYFNQAAQDFSTAAEDLHGVFTGLADRPAISFPTVSADYRALGDCIQGAVSGMGDEMDALRGDIQAAGDDSIADLRAIQAQFREVTDLLLSALTEPDTPSTDDLWDDVSQDEIDQTTLGKARDCANHGAVQGDLNVGGIAGSMAVEYDLDPEDDISRVGTQSLNFHYETRAILQSCVSDGAVTAKKDAAGGVVGRMDLGYLLACENYGPVESTNGDYVGGIAGTAQSVLRSCWSKCALTGGKYVGGVAGYATELYNCTSLVLITSDENWTGAVAGDWDRTGSLSGNRFVPLEGQAGVDGISYAGQAQPVSFEELAQGNIPDRFRQFILTYQAEDTVVEQVTCTYGDSFSDHPAPEVPQQEGCFGAWAMPESTQVDFDYVISACYTPYTTTLASAAQRDNGRPVFLMEGTFDANAQLDAAAQTQSEDGEVWTVQLNGDDGSAHTVRFTPPDGWSKLSLTLSTTDGKETPISWQQDGSCCVFSAPTGSFTLHLNRDTAPSPLLLLLLLPLAGIVLLFLILRRRKRKKPSAQPA